MFYAMLGYLHAALWRVHGAVTRRTRAIQVLAGDRGQGTVEYVGLILLVSLLMVGMVAAMKGFNRYNSKTGYYSCRSDGTLQPPVQSAGPGILLGMPLLSRIKSGRVRRLEDQMRKMRDDMDSRFDLMAETFESRRADEEAAAIAAERIRSGAADHKEDGAEALAKLGIRLP